jgi:hypothetical protein
MTPERFEELAWAYGGDLDRWPAEAQVAARAALAQSSAAQDVLARAGGLDAALDAWRVPAPDGALMRRIAATATRARPLWRRAVVWWSGLAVAATAAAGGGTGALVLAGPAPAPPSVSEMAYESTVFGDVES